MATATAKTIPNLKNDPMIFFSFHFKTTTEDDAYGRFILHHLQQFTCEFVIGPGMSSLFCGVFVSHQEVQFTRCTRTFVQRLRHESNNNEICQDLGGFEPC